MEWMCSYAIIEKNLLGSWQGRRKGERSGRRKMRQLIIARKDLQMGAGKLAAQVAHASMAFLSDAIRKGTTLDGSIASGNVSYHASFEIGKDIYEDWLCGIFTKTVCEAKNKNHLMKAVKMAEEMGMEEGRDFFLIRDACLTDLEPEEVDGEGNGCTLTCIGFKPLDDETAHKISRKYQLYK